jgi:PH domain
MCNCKSGCGNACGCRKAGGKCTKECGCWGLTGTAAECQNVRGCSCGGACKTNRCLCVANGGKCGLACACPADKCVNRAATAKASSPNISSSPKVTPKKASSPGVAVKPKKASSPGVVTSKKASSPKKVSSPVVTPKGAAEPKSDGKKARDSPGPKASAATPPGSPQLAQTSSLARQPRTPDPSPPVRRARAVAQSDVRKDDSGGADSNCCSCVKSMCGNRYCPCVRAGRGCTGCALGAELCQNCSPAHGGTAPAADAASGGKAEIASPSPVQPVDQERHEERPASEADSEGLASLFRGVRLKLGRALFPVSGALLTNNSDPGSGHCGWLQKKGDDLAGFWRTRWFRIKSSENALVYYKDSNEIREQGRIPLVRGEFTITTKGQNYFSISLTSDNNNDSRVYKLWSEQSDDCAEWVEILTKLSARAVQEKPVRRPKQVPAATSTASPKGSKPAFQQVAPSPKQVKGKQPSVYAQQQARRDLWLAELEVSKRMGRRLAPNKFKVLSPIKVKGRGSRAGEWLYRYQVLEKDGVMTIDADPTLGASTATHNMTQAEEQYWLKYPQVRAALEMAKHNQVGRSEPMHRWTKNVIYYAICVVDGEDLGYVGKAKNGIMDRWLTQSSSHCSHAQKMMDGDAAKLDRRQFVDVMLALLGCENFLLIPVAQSDSTETLRSLEEGLIESLEVRGPKGMNIAK